MHGWDAPVSVLHPRWPPAARGHLMGDLCDRGLDLRLSLVLMHFKRTSQQPRVACSPNVMPGLAAAG